MRITVNTSALKETSWSEYAIRFVFGAVATVVTGIIARKFGPSIGGLFLAFPAIFPASVTLLEKYERVKKQRAGVKGTRRARQAASLDAAGASMGSIGLLSFAIFVWKFIPTHRPSLVLIGATLVWGIVSVSVWKIRKAL